MLNAVLLVVFSHTAVGPCQLETTICDRRPFPDVMTANYTKKKTTEKQSCSFHSFEKSAYEIIPKTLQCSSDATPTHCLRLRLRIL